MSRLHRYLLPSVVTFLAMLVCLKLLLTPVIDGRAFAFTDIPKYGWPWLFARSYDSNVLAMFGAGHIESWKLFAADCLVLGAGVAIFSFLIFRAWRRGKYRFRFSLRTSFVAIAAVGICFAWLMNWRWHWSNEQRIFEFQSQADETIFGQAKPVEYVVPIRIDHPYTYCGPEWLRRLWPEEKLPWFHRATSATVAMDVTDDEAAAVLKTLQDMPYVQQLQLADSPFIPILNEDDTYQNRRSRWAHGSKTRTFFLTPDRIRDPSILKHIDTITIGSNGQFSGEDSKFADISPESWRLIGSLTTLEELHISGCPVASLQWVEACPNLRVLNLSGTKIDDSELRHLQTLTKLNVLFLDGTEITDHALDALIRLKTVEQLGLRECPNLTESGARRLIAMPRLQWLELPMQFSSDIQQLIQNDLSLRSESDRTQSE